MNRAHTLTEIVEAGWAPSVHYLVVRLRRKEIRGRKVGRTWLMSDADLDAYIDSTLNITNTPVEQHTDHTPVLKLSSASRRRRIAS